MKKGLFKNKKKARVVDFSWGRKKWTSDYSNFSKCYGCGEFGNNAEKIKSEIGLICENCFSQRRPEEQHGEF